MSKLTTQSNSQGWTFKTKSIQGKEEEVKERIVIMTKAERKAEIAQVVETD